MSFLEIRYMVLSCFLMGLLLFQYSISHSQEVVDLPQSFPKEEEPIFAKRLSDCRCRSLFTMGSCNDRVNPNSGVPPSLWRNVVQQLNSITNGGQHLVSEVLSQVYKYLPGYILNQTEHTRFQKSKDRLSNIMEQFPSTQCGTHLYTSDQVHQCLEDFRADHGNVFRMFFVGDSLSRIILEQMVAKVRSEFTEDRFVVNKKNLTLGEFFNTAPMNEYPVESKNIHLRFFWAPYIDKVRNSSDIRHQGARDILKSWANGSWVESGDQMPHLVYVSAGLWDAMTSSNIDAPDETLKAFEMIKPLLIKSSTSSSFLYHQHNLLKFWMKNEIASETIDFVSQVVRMELKDTPVTVWDTLSLLYGKEREDCLALYLKGVDSAPNSGCDLYNHPGQASREIAGNMIWNLVCNKYQRNSTLCCS